MSSFYPDGKNSIALVFYFLVCMNFLWLWSHISTHRPPATLNSWSSSSLFMVLKSFEGWIPSMYLLSLDSMTEVLIYICLICEVGHKWYFKDLACADFPLLVLSFYLQQELNRLISSVMDSNALSNQGNSISKAMTNEVVRHLL